MQHVSRDMQGPLGERMMSARRESTSRARRGGAELTAECSRGRAAPPQPGHWPSSDAGQAPGAMPSVRAGPSTDAEDRQQLPGNTLGSRAPAKLSRSLHLLLHCAFLCPTKIGEQFYLLETGVHRKGNVFFLESGGATAECWRCSWTSKYPGRSSGPLGRCAERRPCPCCFRAVTAPDVFCAHIHP